MDIDLSPKQRAVLDAILCWKKESRTQFLTLGGYAGTGKTTLLGYLNKILHSKEKGITIAYCSFTGKASLVLKRKLKETKSLKSSDYVGTIHRLIYKAIVDENDRILGWEKIPVEDFKYDLIIVDEASMVSKDIWDDLLSFGVPILAVGDHGQLPPVKGTFNLMQNPVLRLEEIYRQERDNPIIAISELARKYGEIPVMEYSKGVRKFERDDDSVQEFLTDVFSSFNSDLMILTGYNHTRVKLNDEIRRLLEFESTKPEIEDRVICLKNNTELGVYNGMIGKILAIQKKGLEKLKWYEVTIEFDGEDQLFYGNISIEQFGKKETSLDIQKGIDLFDFGYAMTVHKAQGSQAERVVLFEERFPQMSDDIWRRWLYTGVTRAISELYIIGK